MRRDDLLFLEALRRYRNGDIEDAKAHLRILLKRQPQHRDGLYLLGALCSQLQDFATAERLFGEAIALEPEAETYMARGMALQKLQRFTEALQCYEQALKLRPQLATAALARGLALSNLSRYAEALASYRKATELEPRHAEAWFFLGSAQLELEENAGALASFDSALSVKGDHAEAWRLRAITLLRLDQPVAALESVDRALALARHNPDIWMNRAAVLMRLNRHDAALAAYDHALTAKPCDVFLLYGRANALSALKRHEDAMAACDTLLAIAPHYPYARGILIHEKLQCCDWRGFSAEKTKIIAEVGAGHHAISPFNFKAYTDEAEIHHRCARLMVEDQYRASPHPFWRGETYHHERLRLAYVSGDFNDTVVASLMAGVFEQHDRARFETFAISFGPNNRTALRRRLETAFEHFVEARGKSDTEIAAMLRNHEIDIAVDLMGFTGECRPSILARRPAPVQVNYLGFPGTMGAAYIDYIVADETVIPKDQHAFYEEKVVYLPYCYLPQDSKRPKPGSQPSRNDAGLPEAGFVFCCFNNSYKFAPETFAIWMRLLRETEDSVLWLATPDALAMRNLRTAAETHGISPIRLVFAPKLPTAGDHFARLSLADLFLDTLPYNAHATASDALNVGLPLLTCLGESFAGRVAASQLKKLGLPELIAQSLEEYEAKALKLAREPEYLAAIRRKLEGNVKVSPLFDMPRFTRQLEAAFLGMHERYLSGLQPVSFAVEERV